MQARAVLQSHKLLEYNGIFRMSRKKHQEKNVIPQLWKGLDPLPLKINAQHKNFIVFLYKYRERWCSLYFNNCLIIVFLSFLKK